MTPWEAQDWMAHFRVHPPAASALQALQPLLIRSAAIAGGRGARAAVIAFLDRAHGHTDWWTPPDPVVRPDDALRARMDARLRDPSAPIRMPWHVDLVYGFYFGSGDASDLDRALAPDPEWPLELRRHVDRTLLAMGERYPHVAAAARLAGRGDLFEAVSRVPTRGVR